MLLGYSALSYQCKQMLNSLVFAWIDSGLRVEQAVSIRSVKLTFTEQMERYGH